MKRTKHLDLHRIQVFPKVILEHVEALGFTTMREYLDTSTTEIEELANIYRDCIARIQGYVEDNILHTHDPLKHYENGTAMINLMKLNDNHQPEQQPYEGVFFTTLEYKHVANTFHRLNQTKDRLREIIKDISQERFIRYESKSGTATTLSLPSAMLINTPLRFANFRYIYRQSKIIGSDREAHKISVRCYQIPTYSKFTPEKIFQCSEIIDPELEAWITSNNISFEDLRIRYMGKSTRLTLNFGKGIKSVTAIQSVPSLVFLKEWGEIINNIEKPHNMVAKRPNIKYGQTPFSEKYNLYQKKHEQTQ